jgi:hypothetical protein
MSAELLNWVYAYLERDEDIVVPIKKMWNEWHAEHAEPPLEVFERMVLADERFENMGGVDHTEDMDWMEPDEMEEYVRDMEAHDYFSGPRVKLKSRPLTLEHIANMIKKHNDRMEEALRQAREAMPDDISEPEEGQLIDIAAKVEDLRRHLREAGLEASDDPD